MTFEIGHWSLVDYPNLTLTQPLILFVYNLIKVDSAADQFVIIAVAIPARTVDDSALQVKGFSKHKPGRHIIYVKKGLTSYV